MSLGQLDFQGKVPERSYKEKTPEICIGGPLSPWQNIQFCICVVRHHETRQRTTTSERTTNKAEQFPELIQGWESSKF